jgi:hypothetical protein
MLGPNITGIFDNSYSDRGGIFYSLNGCFYGIGNRNVINLSLLTSYTDPNIEDMYRVNLDASRSSNIYSNNVSTVQPCSLILNYIIKY